MMLAYHSSSGGAITLAVLSSANIHFLLRLVSFLAHLCLLLCQRLQVCHSLLPTLTHRKTLTRRLLELQSWQKLADAFARRDPALTLHLSQKLQRALSRCLCLAATGFQDKAPAQQYVSHLLLQTANELGALAGRQQQQLAAAAQQAGVQLQVRT